MFEAIGKATVKAMGSTLHTAAIEFRVQYGTWPEFIKDATGRKHECEGGCLACGKPLLDDDFLEDEFDHVWCIKCWEMTPAKAKKELRET